jgi:hypothetical protein
MAGSRRGVGALVLAALCLLVGACTPTPGETPSPTPPPSVSPTPTENSIERQQRLDYEAAEKSVRTFRTEIRRVLSAGGAGDATPVMKRTSGGEYLKEFTSVVKAYKKLGYRQVGDEKISYLRPQAHSDTSLLLTICTDGRGIKTYDKSGQLVGSGDVRRADIRINKVGSDWKVWSGDGKAVKTC